MTLFSFCSEILTNSIRNTIYPIDFATYSTCPRPMEREDPEVPLNYPIHYDSLAVRWVYAKSSSLRFATILFIHLGSKKLNSLSFEGLARSHAFILKQSI